MKYKKWKKENETMVIQKKKRKFITNSKQETKTTQLKKNICCRKGKRNSSGNLNKYIFEALIFEKS